MPAINPFLRAFFRSSFPSQCAPVNQHILLVPTTEVLLFNNDRETNTPFAELVASEEFLGSHVLKVPPQTPGTKEVGSVRENRGKARQFNTINGKTVVIKESFVYSNKGFKNLNQAQLLSDTLYYHDRIEAQQWLIYYISKPLIGTTDPIKVPIASLPGSVGSGQALAQTTTRNSSESIRSLQSPGKKDIRSFNDLLANFPMIARQMQPGLDRVFEEFTNEVSKPLPPLGNRQPSGHRRRSSSASASSTLNDSVLGGPTYRKSRRSSISSFSAFADEEEDHMRRALENAVTAAIDLFQLVDKQQLSLLGATTDLTGPVVERLIERYVTEQVHHSTLFPRLCNTHKTDDLELESHIRHMVHIDVSQVGIDIDGGRKGKVLLMSQLNFGIREFRKLNDAGSPQRMLEILLETQKALASGAYSTPSTNGLSATEKPKGMTMNADTLVSLLLIVVIRSQVNNLQTRLAYMRSFIFIDDVEGGELGYALSTLEAVLSYLVADSGGLRIASRRNKRLWQATKQGALSEMKSILEPDDGSLSDEPDSFIGSSIDEQPSEEKSNGSFEAGLAEREDRAPSADRFSQAATEVDAKTSSSNLSHVFPFQEGSTSSAPEFRPRAVKRVSIDLRSLNSDVSFHSKTSTIDSITSGIEGDTSIEKLCQTQDSSGNSVLMMAVEAGQPEALAYLLSLEEYYPIHTVLEDTSNGGTTLLSAAVQSSNQVVVEVLVDYISSLRDVLELKAYLDKVDNMSRSVAHYLFHIPHLIRKFGTLLPWREKDKNGQTPLLALCRSYDHPRYFDMVSDALKAATEEQGDGQKLHMDLHVDGKGNSLLHVVSEAHLAMRILHHCDSDPNACNDKRFTPLMVASKFGRFDLVRALFLDNRVDTQAKEYRGMTAVELAKDDEVRNRIDEMVLLSNTPAPDGRVTAAVRSFFVEDATIRLVIKTAGRNKDSSISITTCRRSLADFEHLAKWLALEHPASWLPSIFNFRSPFQIPSKPSRAVLHDTQVRLDKFLEIMLAHSTFSTHELVWEFILVPEIQPDMMAERSLLKSDVRQEKIKEDFEPLEEYRDVEIFVSHARESIRAVSHSTKSTLRRVNGIRNASADLYSSLSISSTPLSTLTFLPLEHITAFTKYTQSLQPPQSDPYKLLHNDLHAISSTILAILSSLSRPHALISSAQAAQKALERHRGSIRRSDRWPLGLLEESRKQSQLDAQERVVKAREELRVAGCELRYTQQTVASELAGWQDLHGKMARRAVRRLAKGMLVKEKDRLECIKRALRPLLEAKAARETGKG